jgi:hypothetical protein
VDPFARRDATPDDRQRVQDAWHTELSHSPFRVDPVVVEKAFARLAEDDEQGTRGETAARRPTSCLPAPSGSGPGLGRRPTNLSRRSRPR